jgi:hypothetical protein
VRAVFEALGRKKSEKNVQVKVELRHDAGGVVANALSCGKVNPHCGRG